MNPAAPVPTDELPPHNLEAEQAVLGSLLIDRDAIALVIDDLSPEDFFHGANGTIYRAICALFKARIPTDFITLTDFLKKKGVQGQAADVTYLSSLLSVTPTATHVGYYAKIVKRDAEKRAIIDLGAQMVSQGYRDDEVDPDALITDIRRQTARFRTTDAPRFLSTIMDDHRTRTQQRWDNKLTELVVPTGISAIDRQMYGGMRAGDLVFIAGRPGAGKTSYAIRLALEAALSTQKAVVFFEMEMGQEAMVNRIIAQTAGLPFGTAYWQIGNQSNRDLFLETSSDIEQLPVVLEASETAPRTTERMMAYCDRLRLSHDIGGIVIDYMDYITDKVGGDNREARASEITQRLKRMGIEFGCPVTVLSQLTREVEDPRNKPYVPRMSHLKGSGMMEGAADYVMLLYRRMYYVEKGMLDSSPEVDFVTATNLHRVEVNLAKAKNGQVTHVELGWDAPAMRFVDVKLA